MLTDRFIGHNLIGRNKIHTTVYIYIYANMLLINCFATEQNKILHCHPSNDKTTNSNNSIVT